MPLPKPSFEGIKPTLILPEPRPGLFAGAYSYINLPKPIIPTKPDFEKITATSILPKPVSPLIFESVTGEVNVRVMFPGGARVVPTYGVGVPLGVEKPLLEPKIQKEEEKE